MRKCLNSSDNHDDVVIYQEPDILEHELNPEEDSPGQTLLIWNVFIILLLKT